MPPGGGSLRSRITLLVAAAVTVAIAVCAGLCWLLVRDELWRKLDESLQQPPVDARIAQMIQRECSADPTGDSSPGPFLRLQQIVTADGVRCAQGWEAVKVAPADLPITTTPGGRRLRDGTTDAGEPVRVLTVNVGPGVAVSVSRSTAEVEGALRGLALLLGVVTALGVLGAAAAGRVISGAALRPIRRLTGAVEHITRTEDLDTRIPVEGEDEIARLSASFNAMTAALAGSRERQRQLIGDAGHELRTPLTSLRANIDLLLHSENSGRSLDPGARTRLLGSVKAQMAEMSSLIGDLLELSRVSGGEEPVAGLPFHEIVAAAADRVRLRAGDVRLAAETTPWYVDGREQALERAVVNLLDNAVKFSPPGGTVTVRLRRGELTVRDHGPGIPEEELPQVFERFWRSSTARSMPGSGLGLAIVAQAVRDAGGRVTLANAPGGGAVARLTLPGRPDPRPAGRHPG
ncbi:two-component sensor histidine kinase [Sphaerisporangium rufum]|uniref:histidine kinase n=1 Tax=Sphaerisporangium rufum TaxID=1381558 RepID=A0A919R5F6_9ACTN|nr:HAMP domain-containing sensor histidine kinase [Sphaerisporangium rufum]GII78640.1 two-component sensor histidine kinase [Sphaerisporangium rufum]